MKNSSYVGFTLRLIKQTNIFCLFPTLWWCVGVLLALVSCINQTQVPTVSTKAKSSLLQRSPWWFLLRQQTGSGEVYPPELHGRLEETRWWPNLVPFLMWVSGKQVIYVSDQQICKLRGVF